MALASDAVFCLADGPFAHQRRGLPPIRTRK